MSNDRDQIIAKLAGRAEQAEARLREAEATLDKAREQMVYDARRIATSEGQRDAAEFRARRAETDNAALLTMLKDAHSSLQWLACNGEKDPSGGYASSRASVIWDLLAKPRPGDAIRADLASLEVYRGALKRFLDETPKHSTADCICPGETKLNTEWCCPRAWLRGQANAALSTSIPGLGVLEAGMGLAKMVRRLKLDRHPKGCPCWGCTDSADVLAAWEKIAGVGT